MPPGRKEWFEDPSDNYVIGLPRFDKSNSNKTNEEFWNNWSNPLHLSDYVPGTRIPKREWKGKKFWEQKSIAKSSSSKARFPTSEGKCPKCGNDLHLIPAFGVYSEFYGCNSFPDCNFKCSVKQYNCVVKEQVPNGEPIEIANTMNAEEAKKIADDSPMQVKIRKQLNQLMRTEALNGNIVLETIIREEHPYKNVLEILDKDGFTASCKLEWTGNSNNYHYIIDLSKPKLVKK